MIDLTKIHQQAAAAAYKAVPVFEMGSQEHADWLAWYDSEFSRLVIEVSE